MKEIENFIFQYFKNHVEDFENDIDFDICNAPITRDEVKFHMLKLKNNKASGIDNIPNEVLKQPDVMLLMYHMFVKFFEAGLIPSLWLKAVITPVPKSSSKDPFVPLKAILSSLKASLSF